MPDPSRVYQALEIFLKKQGYKPDESAEACVGDKVYYWVSLVQVSGCSLSAGSDCSSESVRRLLGHMQKLPGWTKEHHQLALQEGDYRLEFSPWPEKNKAGS
ncbi:MAG: hypothetical protein ACK42D_01220 [Candidatus Paceibacteria bacterium]